MIEARLKAICIVESFFNRKHVLQNERKKNVDNEKRLKKKGEYERKKYIQRKTDLLDDCD